MCIIRCKDRGCLTRRGRVTTSSSQLSEQRNLMFSSHETSWSDMALARKDTDTLQNSETNRSIKSIRSSDKTEARRKTSASGSKGLKGQDVIYQVGNKTDSVLTLWGLSWMLCSSANKTTIKWKSNIHCTFTTGHFFFRNKIKIKFERDKILNSSPPYLLNVLNLFLFRYRTRYKLMKLEQ